ncbi:hypothetical protein [Pandoraea sp. E26]|uniref:hypothetical protein n=1 Tax=Pandoraea sp. E26 TaxID=1427365 RepID=UPI0012680609|nr:hypothetical protein [Pandoraea sp. E26]
MEQVIFWRARWGVLWRDAEGYAYTVAVSTDAAAIHFGQQQAAGAHTGESCQDSGCRQICHCHKLGKVRCHEPSFGHVNPGLPPHHVGRRNSDFRHLVTLTLQGCNAKNIFTEKIPSQLIIFCEFACNVGEGTSIFCENTSVSCAVHSSIDRLMLNSNRTSFSYVPTFTGWFARVTTRTPGNALRRNAGGAL